MGPDAGASDRTTAFLVGHAVAGGGADSVRDLIERERPAEPKHAGWLLEGDAVATVSLFLDAGATGDEVLVWYVELTEPVADDLADVVLDRSPLFDAGLADHLDRDASVGADASRLVVHAANPGRPGTPDDPDVVLVRLPIRAGLGTWLARLLARSMSVLEGTWLRRRFEARSMAVLEAERMWTETLWLERTGGDHRVRWYMEAADMTRALEAYEDTDGRFVRWTEAVLDRLFVEPVRTLEDPMVATDCELVAHATNPASR